MSAEQFDKHLFNLSQQAADESAMTFNEEAWQRMEELLDGDRKKRRFALWWWLLPMLLLGSGTAIYIDQNTSNVALVSNNLEAKIEEPKTNNQTAKAENKVVNNKHTSNRNTNNNDKIEVDESNLHTVTNDIVINTTGKLPSNTQTSIKPSIKNNGANTAKEGISKSNETKLDYNSKPNEQLNRQQHNSVTEVVIVGNSKTTKDTNASKNTLIGTIEITKTNDTIGTLKVADTITKATITIGKIEPKKKPSFPSKFEISAFAAADVSAVDLSLKDPKSLTFGIGLSYQITKKLSIATGFGVSRKLYSADSADYKNQPWVATTYKLKTVDANCLVYELPINLQYQFAQSGKSSWLAVGGISTYFMKNEVYDYNYTWYNQPRKTTYTIEDKNNHLFSILNLAVGYRRQLNKQLSYQLAPFVKIPLTGIGEGKVNLYSAGLQLSVNLKGK